MNFSIHRRGTFLTIDNSDSSVRWVQEQMDDLDVRIAMRDFEDAVRSIEKGNAIVIHVSQILGRQTLASMDPKQATYPRLSLHLSRQIKQLTDYITHALNLESHLPNATKRYSVLLTRLGEDDLARSTYLQSRADYVRRKIRAMQHPGAYGINEVDGFMEAVAWLTVRVIKTSWGVYSETFSETRMASSFFEWVKEQAEGK
jgi:exocyst complex component 8